MHLSHHRSLFHYYTIDMLRPVPVFAFKFTLPPEQKVVAPPAVIVAEGVVLTVTTVAAEVAWQLPAETLTV